MQETPAVVGCTPGIGWGWWLWWMSLQAFSTGSSVGGTEEESHLNPFGEGRHRGFDSIRSGGGVDFLGTHRSVLGRDADGAVGAARCTCGSPTELFQCWTVSGVLFGVSLLLGLGLGLTCWTQSG